MITYHIISLFPESFASYLNVSIIKRAQEKGLINIKFYNPRDFVIAKNKSKNMTYADRRVDDKPYGGGPGMVIEALPVIKAIDKAIGKKLSNTKNKKSIKIVFFSPSGKLFDNNYAQKFTKYTDIVFVCGRYEGIDVRIKKVFPMIDISVGDFVLTGGELPVMILVDSITRRIEGVLGDHDSIEENRISSSDVYTRPAVLEYKGKKYKVPKVLLTGNHAKIDDWKMKKGKADIKI
jgi:tRNA (guanine37-N1)-methyltransferase